MRRPCKAAASEVASPAPGSPGSILTTSANLDQNHTVKLPNSCLSEA